MSEIACKYVRTETQRVKYDPASNTYTFWATNGKGVAIFDADKYDEHLRAARLEAEEGEPPRA